MSDLNPAHFAIFRDWDGRTHVQYRICAKTLKTVKLCRKGLLLASVRRNKAAKRGITYLPAPAAAATIGSVLAYSSFCHGRIDEGAKEILSEVYKSLGHAAQGEGSKPGSPDDPRAGSVPAATTRAGAAD